MIQIICLNRKKPHNKQKQRAPQTPVPWFYRYKEEDTYHIWLHHEIFTEIIFIRTTAYTIQERLSKWTTSKIFNSKSYVYNV